MKHDSFQYRLAYLRWRQGLGQPKIENDADFARRAGVGYEWLKKWMVRDDAPPGRAHAKILSRALDAHEDWLFDGDGEPPDKGLWDRWTGAHAAFEGGDGLPEMRGDSFDDAEASERPKRRKGS